ncbi:MAG: SRPBCC family protein [bacterium]
MRLFKTALVILVIAFSMSFTHTINKTSNHMPLSSMDTTVTIPRDYTSVTSSVIINATKEKVWETMFTNFSEVSNYFYSALHSECPNDVKGEVGAQRVCYFNDSKSKYTKEEIIAFAEQEYMYVKVLDAKPKLEAIAKCELEKQSEGRVLITQTLYYKTKPKFVGKVFKGSIKKEFEAALIGMKYFIETGEAVDKKNFKAIKKAIQKDEAGR